MEIQQRIKMENKWYYAFSNLLITSLHKRSKYLVVFDNHTFNSHIVWITILDVIKNRGRQTERVREENIWTYI